MTLDSWLRSRPDRCPRCGHHPPTQGHGEACAPTGPESEWRLFVGALQQVVRPDGRVHQHDVRLHPRRQPADVVAAKKKNGKGA